MNSENILAVLNHLPRNCKPTGIVASLLV